jgi:hypothetical protein
MICIAFEKIMFEIETLKGKSLLKSENIVSYKLKTNSQDSRLISSGNAESNFPGNPGKTWTGTPGKETLVYTSRMENFETVWGGWCLCWLGLWHLNKRTGRGRFLAWHSINVEKVSVFCNPVSGNLRSTSFSGSDKTPKGSYSPSLSEISQKDGWYK